jgi:hypothetical protein
MIGCANIAPAQEMYSVVSIDLTKPPKSDRDFPLSLETDQTNFDWLNGMVQETGLSRSLLLHRILTSARQNIGIATVDGERRMGERRSA